MNSPSRLVSLMPLILVVVWALTVASNARAGGGAENVAIIVNDDSWASKAVANEYMSLWDIPRNNIIYLSDVPSFETIDVETFRNAILLPILDALEERRLLNQIDYIAYSSDFPYAVRVQSDVGDRTLPQVITTTGSLNGLTYLYQPVLAKDPVYLSLSSNFYFNHTGPVRDTDPWTEEQRDEYGRATQLLQEQNLAEAERLLRATTIAHPNFNQAWYNYACCLALMNRSDEAMAALERAAATGWSDAGHTAADPDLESLRSRRDFQQLVDAIGQPRIYPVTATRGFRAVYGWTPQGRRVDDDSGVRYMLSTMLAVTAGRGTSVAEAIGYLRRARGADAAHPQGTFYFMKNSNVRSTTRQWGFPTAVAVLRELGHRAEVYEGTSVPKERGDLMGLMAGTATLKWDDANSSIVAGAICEHLTSTGGTMRQGGSQTPLSVFLQAGAAGSSGTVIEPYALQQKFPTPMMHVHYARGASLAEAFYQSVEGPYQLLIVGDPLCSPWAARPEVQVPGFVAGRPVRGVVQISPQVTNMPDRSIKGFELFIDGRRVGSVPPGGNMRLDTNDLSDGYHELRLVAVRNDSTETQGRAIIPVVVSNEGRQVRLTVGGGGRITYGDSVQVEAAAEGATAIDIMHNGRTLAAIDGPRGTARIETRTLGMARSQIRAVARFGGEDAPARDRVSSSPVEVLITPKPPAPNAEVDARRLKPGLRVSFGGQAVVSESSLKATWLEEAGVSAGETFTISGWVKAAEDDVYQLALQTNRSVTVEVDGEKVPTRQTGKWQYFPLSLGAGLHEVTVKATGGGPPRVDIRFGRDGTQSIAAPEFLHLPE